MSKDISKKLQNALENKFLEISEKGTAYVDNKELKKETEVYLKNLLSESLKIPVDDIDSDTLFEKYGIDSVVIMDINRKLEKIFNDLPKTLFFEYQTIHDLVNYFIEEHSTILSKTLSVNETIIESAKPELTRNKLSTSMQNTVEDIFQTQDTRSQDIAVIGLSGQYPEAKDIDHFWENLKSGKDCIKEIPRDRWNMDAYYDQDKDKLGKVYSRWGGFIEDVDKFDPLFFNISPVEAEMIDPQERLFLETTWKTLEDAGYSGEELLKQQVGVFVGVMYGEYQLYGAEESLKGNIPFALSSSYASIANRVSYFCNFHGPSIALDTMCSSSLTSIHLACAIGLGTV